MQELIVVSGKGGTGKTSLAAAFAGLARNKVLCDADVDAADLHLILSPDIRARSGFQSGHTAVIDPELCTACGTCRQLCRFEAIRDDFVIDPIACEGCGVCHHFCPEGAIQFPLNTCGEWYVSETRFGPLVHARLGIAEENSGKLVTLVRQEAAKLAKEAGFSMILTDGPPGIGCPVIAAIGGAAAMLIVAEPTVSGIHDMQRLVDLAAHFRVPALVSVNKWDLNPEKTAEIEDFARSRRLSLVGNIPFDPIFTRSMVKGQNIFEAGGRSRAAEAVKAVWERVTAPIGAQDN